MQRNKFLIVLGILYFSTRIIFFLYLPHSQSYQTNSISVREPSKDLDGTFYLQAQNILAGKTIQSSDDLGFPLAMAGLNKLGVPLDKTFNTICFILMIISFVFLCVLYNSIGRKILFLYLTLYPPAIYHTFAMVSRILPVYALLICLVILLNSRNIFDHPIYGCLSACMMGFLLLARNTNNIIFICFLVAFLIQTFREKLERTPLHVFTILLIFFFGLGKFIFPHQEHSFWHPVYLGLGDFDKKYIAVQDDHFAYMKAKEENPALAQIKENIDLSPSYDPTLKKMTLRIIKNHPTWYIALLSKRFLTVVIHPFQGSWLFEDDIHKILKYSTACLDLTLTLLGGFMAFVAFVKDAGKGFPYLILLSGTLYVFAFVMVSNRTLFLAGTLFYQSFAIRYLDEKETI